MIIALVLNFIANFIAMIFSVIPTVTVSSIPFIGTTVNSLLITGVGYWNTFLNIIPYFRLPWDMFINVIVPFELTLLLLKVFMGHRTPANNY